MTFSTFVVGKNSEFAHAACYNVARNPGDSYNPLLISGPTGLGKTHLLLAVGHEIRRSFPHLNVVYIQAEMFLESYVNAIMTKNNEAFRKKYRDNCDVFLVDDIQFINVGERTQVEFFHIINYLLERKKQIVLASDRMPKDILGLTDRNRSRLEWGLIVEISMPDFETRMAILRYKMEQHNMVMPDEVIEYIAKISKTSIRQLEGNLKKIKMFADLQGSKIDYAMAKRVLTTHENTNTLTIEEIQRIVADHYKIKVTDLKSSSRANPIKIPRQVAMFLIKKYLEVSLVEIGKAFGDRDHTTVINSIGRIEDQQTKDSKLANDLNALHKVIQNIIGV
jgi:chromosomal replication initiator protein